MARPMKEPEERRSAKLPPIRLTDAELAHVKLQAEEAGLTVTELVRQRVISVKVTPKRSPAVTELLSELNRIGVNLNQIARSLNRGGDRDPHHLGHVLGKLVETLEHVGRRT